MIISVAGMLWVVRKMTADVRSIFISGACKPRDIRYVSERVAFFNQSNHSETWTGVHMAESAVPGIIRTHR